MSTHGDKVILKANLPRVRDLSFVGRFHHNYGFEDAMFDHLLHQKDLWQDKLFYFDESDFANWVAAGDHHVHKVQSVANSKLQFPHIKGQPLPKSQLDELFGPANGVDVEITKNGKSSPKHLVPGHVENIRDFTDRNALAVNVGGSVSAMEWLPWGDLLAVAVVHSPGGISDAISAPSLSIFGKGKSSEALTPKTYIQMWKYDATDSTFSLQQTLGTSSFGGVAKLIWLPVRSSGESAGIVSGAFSDGKVHFFNISLDSGVEMDVTHASWSISLRDERSTLASRSTVPITAYDVLDESTVVVGTLDGAIAEFRLPGTDETPQEPSFVEYVVDSCINSITVATVHEDKVLLVNSATSQSFALQYSNLRQSRVDTHFTILPLKPLYHRGYRIFVYPDSSESIGYTFARHPHQKHSLLLKTDIVTAFCTSTYLNHPFAIVGTGLGDVHVLNLGRKLFGILKAHNKLVVPLKLWSLSTPDNGATFLLCADYTPVSTDKPDVMMSFMPPEIAISACSWRESLEGSTTYAFATCCGLLVVERLDPLS